MKAPHLILLATTFAPWLPHLPAADPPVAEKRPVETTLHDDTRIDEYAWLREKENPATLDYLKAENAHAESTMAHTGELQKRLYAEMVGRLKQTDLSVPHKNGPFYYYSRSVEGLNYPVFCRKFGSLDAPEEIVLDENAVAAGREFLQIPDRNISPDHRYLAYAIDPSGYEEVSVSVKDLATGITYPDVVTKAAPGGLTWAADGSSLFYLRVDETKRANRVYRHEFVTGVKGGDGAKAAEDVLVYQEDDVRFSVEVSRTGSDKLVVISSDSSTTSEVRVVDARKPAAPARLIAPRQQGVRLSVDHRDGADGGWLYILTDANDSPNFELVRAPVADPSPDHWETVIAHSAENFLESIDTHADFLVLGERRDGFRSLRIRRYDNHEEHTVKMPEEVATVWGGNAEYDTGTIRLSYSSMVTPFSIYDYEVATRKLTLLKQQEVLGGYDPKHYETYRILARATDGVEVPISIVHRRGLEKHGKNPCLLYGYGSYGMSIDPHFRAGNISLLDRGFVVAVGHIRGGGELGRSWKEDGKMMKKKNTFTDFIACAEHLIKVGYTDPEHLAIEGKSAGGLLVGATINLRPDLFKAAHAGVPFVDVLNTMLDGSIPLTTGEYEEWGNPNDAESYRYIKSYSPYDNVAAQSYPDLLVTAGLNDSRVHYWEPAKWVARLRDRKKGNSMLLLKTNMGAGHGGASGRYNQMEETAFEFAFLIDRLGAPEKP